MQRAKKQFTTNGDSLSLNICNLVPVKNSQYYTVYGLKLLYFSISHMSVDGGLLRIVKLILL